MGPRTGLLPRDARLKLMEASKKGAPGSLTRRKAIDAAYHWIDCEYPEYLRQNEEMETENGTSTTD